jgi:4-diphosphocytidyl-2-C-methyl-D-erythritol kinase
MASQLGSDVPLFILGGTTLGLNKGEKVERLPSLTIGPQIIVNTGLSIRTEEVYKCINHDFFPPSSIKDLLMSGQSIPRRNDLAPFAYQVNSNLQKIASVLSGTGGDAMLCGSGGCFSALYTSDDACRSAMHWLHEHKPYWKVYDIRLPR